MQWIEYWEALLSILTQPCHILVVAPFLSDTGSALPDLVDCAWEMRWHCHYAFPGQLSPRQPQYREIISSIQTSFHAGQKCKCWPGSGSTGRISGDEMSGTPAVIMRGKPNQQTRDIHPSSHARPAAHVVADGGLRGEQRALRGKMHSPNAGKTLFISRGLHIVPMNG